jgi:hypothetical protein
VDRQFHANLSDEILFLLDAFGGFEPREQLLHLAVIGFEHGNGVGLAFVSHDKFLE